MLLDTFRLLCLLNAAEPFHEAAVICFEQASVRSTHSYVLAELIALADARRLPRVACLDFVASIQSSTEIETVWVDEELHRAAFVLLQSRHDKFWSLCDAVSFVLMQRRDLVEALTNDRHFQQAGFQRLLV